MSHVLKKIKGEIRIISGCEDCQYSSDVQDITNVELPNPAGKTGGACTSAILQVLYRQEESCDNQKKSVQSVLHQMRDILKDANYSQIPQLTNSKPFDIGSQFNIVPEYCKGKRSALIVGINYVGQQGELRGCHNDARNMKSYLMNAHSFQEENILMLMDDNIHILPTKENILKHMRKLVAGSRKGDSCFFHYSGHGGKVKNTDGHEDDDYDETLCPLDIGSAGHIIDDDIFKSLISAVPEGVVVTCLMDCCHGGTVLDLPYVFKADDECLQINEKHKLCVPESDYDREVKHVVAEIHIISACKHPQISAHVFDVDPYELPNPEGKAGGACTSALLKVLYSDNNNDSTSSFNDSNATAMLSFQDVIIRMREILEERNMSQTPQLTSSRPLDIKKPFYIVPGNFKGTCRAVIIGINYTGQNGELRGCQNDARNMKSYLMNAHGFQEKNITMLLDDNIHIVPTKENILNSFVKLAQISEEGDVCFVHYSGHGGSVKDINNDESDGWDETLCPVDIRSSGHIFDDEVFSTLIINMPKAVNLTCVIDACHSGTALDLPYIFKATSRRSDAYVTKMELQPQFDSNNTRDVANAMRNGAYYCSSVRHKKFEDNLNKNSSQINRFDDDDTRDEMLSQSKFDKTNDTARDTDTNTTILKEKYSNEILKYDADTEDNEFISNHLNCMDIKGLWDEIRCDMWGNKQMSLT